MRAMRLAAWLGMAALGAMLLLGWRTNWLLVALPMAALAVAAVLMEFEERHRDPRTIALAGVLVALATASRQMLHGVEFSPVFFIVILAGYVFGPTLGFTVGALTMFTSNFFLGQGPWTPFQMLALGLTGGLAAALPKPRRHEMPMLSAYAVASAYMYGMITDAFSWMSLVPGHGAGGFGLVIAAGMLANTARAVGNLFFMTLLGPVLLKIMRRFRARLKSQDNN